MAQEKTTQESAPKPPVQPVQETAQPPVPPPKRASTFLRYVIPTIAVIFLLANVGLFIYLQINLHQNAQNQQLAVIKPTPVAAQTAPKPTPSPTPYPLPQGKEAFGLSWGPGTKGPRVITVTIDPYDPKIGESQTYIAEVSYTQPVKSVELTLSTDKKTAGYPMQKIADTAAGSTWSVKITTDDTHFYTYAPSFTAKTATEQSFPAGLTLRAY